MSKLLAAIRSQTADLPAVFWWLWGAMLVSALATFVFPFLAFFLTARGFTPLQTGLAVSLLGAGGAAASPVAGWLADHVGRRPTLLGGLLLSASVAVALGLLSSLWMICAAVLLFGFASHLPQPPIAATIADVIAPQHRTRAFSLLYWANNVGIGASLLVGGVVAEKSWLALFLADAATTLLCAALIWRRVPETRPVQPPAHEARSDSGWRAILADRAFLTLLLLATSFSVVLMQFLAGAPIDMARHGLSAQSFGLVFIVNTALIAALAPFAGKVTERFPHTRVLAVASLLLGAGYGAYALCAHPWQYALATAVLSLGEIAYIPVMAALVAQLAPEQMRGRYQGAYVLTWGIAHFLAPVLGSAVLDRFGSAALWSACLAMGVAACAGFLAFGRAHPPHVSPAGS
jgi:predicted MFS family arabinose efflux permease